MEIVFKNKRSSLEIKILPASETNDESIQGNVAKPDGQLMAIEPLAENHPRGEDNGYFENL